MKLIKIWFEVIPQALVCVRVYFICLSLLMAFKALTRHVLWHNF